MATNVIEEQLDCPICTERYDTPKQLPCQHIYCLRCLEQLEHSAESRGVLQCPECRAMLVVPPRGVSGFPTSVVMQRLLENVHPPRRSISTTSDIYRNPNSTSLSDICIQVIDGEVRQTMNHTPFDSNSIQIRESNELELAIQMSKVEEEERNRKVEEELVRRPENRQKELGCVALNKVDQFIRCVGDRLANNHRDVLSVFIVSFLVITITRFMAGALKIDSECKEERHVALYLFVKACVAVFFWGVLCVWNFRRVLKNALRNTFVLVYLVIDTLFSFFWLLLGTVWFFGNFSILNSQCSTNADNWKGYFFYFALILMVLDYIGSLLFLFYSGYTICDKDNEN